MSARTVVEPRRLKDESLLGKINEEMEHRCGLTHATIQLELAEADRPHV